MLIRKRTLCRAFVCVFLVAAFTLCLACRGKKEEPVVPKQTLTDNLFHASQIPNYKRLNRDSAQPTLYDKKSTTNATISQKTFYTAINFPYPFTIEERFATKGKSVKKGAQLFVINSPALEKAIARYNKTKDPAAENNLRAIGFDPKTIEPTDVVSIISPVDGVIIAVPEDIPIQDTQKYPIAVIQTVEKITFQIPVSPELATENSTFYLPVGENRISLELVSLEGGIATLAIPPGTNEQLPERVTLTITTPVPNAFPLKIDAVFSRNNKSYCFVDLPGNIIEKREIEGFPEGDRFIVTSGLRQNETVINDAVAPILAMLKI